ncbi:MAG TPA: hypothetical protein EYP19_08650 [Desulfobacterales bacterium]|nr:hypothetical protein [Desulfobacterales bacterium]
MFEYVFFNEALKGRFVAMLDEEAVAWTSRNSDESFSVFVSEDIDDDIEERLEAVYDGLMDEQRSIVVGDEMDAGDGIHRVGVQFSNAEGVVGQVHLDPELVNRLLRDISIEELQELVQTVAIQVMSGGTGALCGES